MNELGENMKTYKTISLVITSFLLNITFATTVFANAPAALPNGKAAEVIDHKARYVKTPRVAKGGVDVSQIQVKKITRRRSK